MPKNKMNHVLKIDQSITHRLEVQVNGGREISHHKARRRKVGQLQLSEGSQIP